jgi:hypothetical protein
MPQSLTNSIYPCYNLDLECPPKAHVLKTWSLVQSVVLLGGSRSVEVGPGERKLGYWGQALERDTGSLSL